MGIFLATGNVMAKDNVDSNILHKNAASYQVGKTIYQLPKGSMDSHETLIGLIDAGQDVSEYGVVALKLKGQFDNNEKAPGNVTFAYGVHQLQQASTYTTPYLNDYDQQFSSTCPQDMFVSVIKSVHHNHYEDRRFQLVCSRYKVSGTSNYVSRNEYADAWSGYVNEYDRDVNYTCPNGQFLVGIGGIHHNHYEDRRFRFACSSMVINGSNAYATSCGNTGTSDWDQPNHLGNSYGALNGVRSQHHNHYEDRRSSASYCSAAVGF